MLIIKAAECENVLRRALLLIYQTIVAEHSKYNQVALVYEITAAEQRFTPRATKFRFVGSRARKKRTGRSEKKDRARKELIRNHYHDSSSLATGTAGNFVSMKTGQWSKLLLTNDDRPELCGI